MYLPYIGFLITVFSAIRLAKFNIDTRQTDSFIGVPTPANSILICSLPLLLHSCTPLRDLEVFSPDGNYHAMDMNSQFTMQLLNGTILNPWFLIGLTLLMSYLLVAELPLFALKFKNFTWNDNKIRYIFLALCLALLIIFKVVGIPFIIVLYVILSIINNLTKKKPA
jgi:CDP-diacylglycerol--serine O-phosphatidyltransferase